MTTTTSGSAVTKRELTIADSTAYNKSNRVRGLTLLNHDKESDPTNASANVSADIPPTHYQHINQHTANASADTLLTLPREKRNSKSPLF